MTEIHLSHVMPSFLCENRTRSNRSKFLAGEKSRTRMHDKRYKFLVRVSRARNLDQELGSCVMGLGLCGATVGGRRAVDQTCHTQLHEPASHTPLRDESIRGNSRYRTCRQAPRGTDSCRRRQRTVIYCL